MYLWIGRAVLPNIMQDLFGVYSLEQIDPVAFEMKVAEESDSHSFARLFMYLRLVRTLFFCGILHSSIICMCI